VDAGRHSVSALAAGLFRAVHTRRDVPALLDDPWGERLLLAAERAVVLERLLLMLSAEERSAIAAVPDRAQALDLAVRANPAYGTIVVRSRYAEDQLADALAAGVHQYVLIGAGMDTLGLRRPDLLDTLTIVEIDHPATQAMKRDRLARAGLEPPPNVRFVPADLEQGPLASALAQGGYRADAPALFVCLGVTPYLSFPANQAVLQAAGAAATGSRLVFDYLDLEAFGAHAPEATRRMAAERAASDEPWRSGFDPATLPGELAAAGLALVEDLDASAATARYLEGRTDRITISPNSHLVLAVATGGSGV
jgi:methyltransferase (TIGR00027 family)